MVLKWDHGRRVRVGRNVRRNFGLLRRDKLRDMTNADESHAASYANAPEMARDLYDVLSTTRSIRKIASTDVPEDVLHRITQAAVWAPSGGNRQPWRLIAVRDRDIKQKLSTMYVEEWSDYVDFNLDRLPDQSAEAREQARAAFGTGTALAESLAEIPVVALFVHDPRMLYVTDASLGRHPVVGGASLYPAVQNFLVAARAEGLGGVLTTLICSREQELRDLLQIPAPWAVHAMVPLGYPRGRHGALRRSPVEHMLMIDRWHDGASQ